jgi:hypothetical protein
MAASADTVDGQAALGEGFVIFKFKVTDIDPIADDASDVRITCMLIQNLGTATGGGTSSNIGVGGDDIAQVMVMDQDSNSIAPPDEPEETGASVGGGCDELAQTNNPGNSQIAWEVFFDDIDFIIPDDGSEVFQVAVRVNETDELEDESQNHTLVLRATVQIQEVVGSPPDDTEFIERVTDEFPEVIWNGGINSWTDDTYVIDPLMPGETGVVSRFTICDYDSNEHQLILNRFYVKQYEDGTALSSDVVSLDLYRVEGFTRTLIASRTPDGDFHRSSGAANGMPLPGGGSSDNITDPRFAVTVPDDTCYKFELEAQISPFAFKGHTIQPRIQISAEEPRATPIDDTVNPEIRTHVKTIIGKGLISIPDTHLIGKPGVVPINVAGVQLPGFGTLQVGPRGMLGYNPNVIEIKSITGVHPYVVDAVEIDNRRGEARFDVRIDPTAGNPFLTSFKDGTIAEVRIIPIGKPGTMSRWMLMYDCFELIAQMNCLPQGFPFEGTPNQNPNNDISVENGKVILVHPGDIDLDGQPTVTDAVKLATAMLPCIDGESMPNPDLQTPSRTMPPPFNKIVEILLTDEQKSIADVAAPFATEDEIPDCGTLTSGDVREIARLAINFDSMPAPKPVSYGLQQAKPWYSFLNEFWAWLTGTSMGADQATVSLNENATQQAFDIAVDNLSGTALGGIQGRLYFDPNTMNIQAIAGINGYQVMAADIDNLRGEVRFLALGNQTTAARGDVVRLSVNTFTDAARPTLAVEFLVDEDGNAIPFAVNEQQHVVALNPMPLAVHGIQALSQPNGAFRFQAQGQGIAGIRVQVFDLAGGRVFDQEAAGNALNFQPMNSAGQPLANGVYLYTLTAKGFHGEQNRSQVQKLVILR